MIKTMTGDFMKVVCIGGGHGLSQVVSAIEHIADTLTAIVATTDNGGSTGRLRQDPSLIALGDIRLCIDTLASNNHFLAQLGEQRFESKNELHGHCLGNVMLTALCQSEGSATNAVLKYAELLGVKHCILPMCETPVDLIAQSSDGERVIGECEVDSMQTFPDTLSLSKQVTTTPGVIRAIDQADIIIIGPGSLLTSVLPPLLIPDIRRSLERTSACRIFIENLAPEGSVVDQISTLEQPSKAAKLLGYHFFDISLSPAALTAMDLRKVIKTQSERLHSKTQLAHIIQQLGPKLNYSKLSVVGKTA